MNSKKGFTLVELLGVIVIIGVLALIAVPTVQTMIKKSKRNAYNNLLTTIKLAMTNWEMDNKDIDIPVDQSIYLTISQLKSENYLENQLINPLTDEMVSNNMLLKITNSANGYTYEVMESTGNNTDNYTTATPKLVLSDGFVRILKVGDNYTLPSLTVYKLDGSNDVLAINPKELNGKTINTSVVGSYNFVYSVTIDGVPLSIVENVFVK